VSVDYHAAGMGVLYISLAMSVLTGIDYLWRFARVLRRADAREPARPT
jgi:hypothetical protein